MGVAGAIFGALALIAIHALPAKGRRCPSCAETVKLAASRCRYCGSELPDLPAAGLAAEEATELTVVELPLAQQLKVLAIAVAATIALALARRGCRSHRRMEAAGLEILETLSSHPDRRIDPKAAYPSSMKFHAHALMARPSIPLKP
jgi:hypothetical protein